MSSLAMINRNVSPKTTMPTKLCLYSSVILPTIGFGLACWWDSKRSSRVLENFQKLLQVDIYPFFYRLQSNSFTRDSLLFQCLHNYWICYCYQKLPGLRGLNRLKPAQEKRTEKTSANTFHIPYFKTRSTLNWMALQLAYLKRFTSVIQWT